jgi:excisionase family DNA binding protein
MSGPRCYTVAQLLGVDLLNMSRSTFFELKKAGELPYLEEIKPRSGRRLRFRADLVDRYLAGQWGQSRSFASHRRLAS